MKAFHVFPNDDATIAHPEIFNTMIYPCTIYVPRGRDDHMDSDG